MTQDRYKIATKYARGISHPQHGTGEITPISQNLLDPLDPLGILGGVELTAKVVPWRKMHSVPDQAPIPNVELLRIRKRLYPPNFHNANLQWCCVFLSRKSRLRSTIEVEKWRFSFDSGCKRNKPSQHIGEQ